MIHENSLKNLEKGTPFTERPANSGMKKGQKTFKTLMRDALASPVDIVRLMFKDTQIGETHYKIAKSMKCETVGEYESRVLLKEMLQGNIKAGELAYKRSGEATTQNLNLNVDKSVSKMTDDELDNLEKKIISGEKDE